MPRDARARRVDRQYRVLLFIFGLLLAYSIMQAEGMAADGMQSMHSHVMAMKLPSSLPASLVEFMEENEIDESLYEGADGIDRYIRINPRRQVDIKDLAHMLGHCPAQIQWNPLIYSLPSSVRIASCPAYQQGRIYGIDLSSAAAGDCAHIWATRKQKHKMLLRRIIPLQASLTKFYDHIASQSLGSAAGRCCPGPLL